MKSNQVHILLVAENVQEVAETKRAFLAHGLENIIHVAPNGKIAMDMLLGTGGGVALAPVPQIILLDLNLPDMCGLAFLKALRQNAKLRACSVFVMTREKSEQHILEAYNLHVAGYILKPLHYESFQEAIGTLHSFLNLIEFPN